MHIKQFFLGMFLLISLGIDARNIDSLWNVYQQTDAKKDTLILKVIYEIASETRFSNTDTTLYLLKKGLEHSKTLNHSNYIPYYYETMGDTYWQLSDFNKSKTAYKNALNEFFKLGEKVFAGYMHANIAYIFMEMGKYEDALMSLENALKIAEKEKSEGLEILTLSYMANLYASMKQHKKAIETYKKTLAYYKKNENTRKITWNGKSHLMAVGVKHSG